MRYEWGITHPKDSVIETEDGYKINLYDEIVSSGIEYETTPMCDPRVPEIIISGTLQQCIRAYLTNPGFRDIPLYEYLRGLFPARVSKGVKDA